MTKKIRKAIVISSVYELIVFTLVIGNTYYFDDSLAAMVLWSIPTIAYWAWVFIRAGDSPE